MAENTELVIERGAGARGGEIVVSERRGSLTFEKFSEIVDFSLYMAKSGKAVPAFLRGNPGSCMAVVLQANEWGFSPYAVAQQAYEVNDRIAYQAQLIHAVVERRAPLQRRLQFQYEGEGVERRILVTGHIRGELEPLVYTSPRIKDIRPQNSPLWKSDPDQQLSYYGSRAWGRRFCPDVLLGVYATDELEGPATQHLGADAAKDVTPQGEGLRHRLSARAAAQAGFDAKGIVSTIDEAAGRSAPEAANETASGVASGAQAAAAPLPSSPVGITSAAADPLPPGGSAPDSVPQTASAPADEASERVGPTTEASSQERVAQDSAAKDASGGVAAELPPEAASPGTSVDAASSDSKPHQPPEPPKDGSGYVAYAKAWFAEPGMDDAEKFRIWWGSAFQRKLRNGLPNYTDEIHKEVMGLVTARLNELKGGAT